MRLRATIIGVLTAVLVLVGFTVLPSGAVDNEGVCEGTHLDPPDDTSSFTYTAPEGFLISAICVKAGSIVQGDGPEVTTFNPPVASVTIEHSTGKDVSHYTVTLVPVTTPTTPTTQGDDPPTTTTTECPDCTPGTVIITTTTTEPPGDDPGTTTTTIPRGGPPVTANPSPPAVPPAGATPVPGTPSFTG